MHLSEVTGDPRLLTWQRVREYAVPPPMIETATARRLLGDWAGACAAARVDVGVDLRALRRLYGPELAAAVRADLRHLAPDLLRWHLPRVMPDGLLRPDVTSSLARYALPDGGTGHLVVRTPPAWASGPQRIRLAWWDAQARPAPRPDRRFRFDLHRHLWDARRSAELPERAGFVPDAAAPARSGLGSAVAVPSDWAVARWAAEAALLMQAEGTPKGGVMVRLGSRRLVLRFDDHGLLRSPTPEELTALLDAPTTGARQARRPRAPGIAVLPDVATWVPPDILLLQAGLIAPGDLHPLVAEALVPGSTPRPREAAMPGTRQVACRGAVHRLAVVDGVLTALDHTADEIRLEDLLARFGGTPLPCLHVIDQLHRAPSGLPDVRARLDHGDADSALALVGTLLGPEAVLRAGDLHDELAAAAAGRVAYGAHLAGLLPVLLDAESEYPSSRAVARSDQGFRATYAAAVLPRGQRDRRTRRLLAAAH